MKKQGKGKRKVKDYKECNKEIKINESDNENENENNENISQEKEKEKNKKNKNDKKNNKKLKKPRKNIMNESIIEASKVSYEYITKIMEKGDKSSESGTGKNSNSNSNNNLTSIQEEKKEDESEEGKNKIDEFFLSSLYDIFNDYDEIIIKRDKNKQYIINASIKIEEGKEIKFEIIYDNEREYFDYYPNNINFEFEKEDEPFNYDLDIPKEDFCQLVRNFKKYKKN